MRTTERAGVLLIDKPEGPTSRNVLDGLEKRLQIGALGHAGTLDPLATGLLIGLSGVARRLQDTFLGSDKVYEARLHLGATSETLDREGPIAAQEVLVVPGADVVLSSLQRFVGEVDQIPPAHSAVHVAGQRAYKLARSGEVLNLPARKVSIRSLELVSYAFPILELRVQCGAGTYIRSLARDLGQALETGAYLDALRRVQSGIFRVEEATSLEAFREENVLALEAVLLRYPRIDVDASEAKRLRQGALIDRPKPAESPAFAWFEGRPHCRVKWVEGRGLRSDLLLAFSHPA